MTHADRLLAVLRDGKAHSHTKLYRELGIMVHSRVADLRKRGHTIDCRREGDLYIYQLVASSPVGLVSNSGGTARSERDISPPLSPQAARSTSPRAGETVSRRAHNPETLGSTPRPATSPFQTPESIQQLRCIDRRPAGVAAIMAEADELVAEGVLVEIEPLPEDGAWQSGEKTARHSTEHGVRTPSSESGSVQLVLDVAA